MRTHFFASDTEHRRGFTLIEILVVVGMLAVLLAITLIAINPARQFAQANNTQRTSDVTSLLNAIHQYASDNKGVLPAGIDTTVRTICAPTASCTAISPATGVVDLCSVLVPTYIADLPHDPSASGASSPGNPCGSTYNTNYNVVKSASGDRVTVSAPGAQLSQTISVTR